MLESPNQTMRHISKFHKDEDGLSTVEYIIILILIAVVAIGAWRNFGESVEYQVHESTGEVNSL